MSKRPRLQVVISEEITEAMEVIRRYRPGLVTDSALVTSALVEYALLLESSEGQLGEFKNASVREAIEDLSQRVQVLEDKG